MTEVKANSSAKELAKKYFSSYAENLCKMPGSVWGSVPSSKDCQQQVVSEVAYELRFVFAGYGEEGDVCAQL